MEPGSGSPGGDRLDRAALEALLDLLPSPKALKRLAATREMEGLSEAA